VPATNAGKPGSACKSKRTTRPRSAACSQNALRCSMPHKSKNLLGRELFTGKYIAGATPPFENLLTSTTQTRPKAQSRPSLHEPLHQNPAALQPLARRQSLHLQELRHPNMRRLRQTRAQKRDLLDLSRTTISNPRRSRANNPHSFQVLP
jgi:hypothetical protein